MRTDRPALVGPDYVFRREIWPNQSIIISRFHENMTQANPTGRAPDFIGIGAQKAGTSWLYAQLCRHPDIWTPGKEMHYFDRLGGTHDADWYRSLFVSAPAANIVGEITPKYAICEATAIDHMYAVAPHAKLLFMVRHPVDRYWSQCLVKYTEGTLSTDTRAPYDFFDKPLGKPRGLYSRTLIEFCRVFDPASVLIIFYDAISLRPAELLSDVFQFLSLPNQIIAVDLLNQRVNANRLHDPMPTALRKHVSLGYAKEVHLLASVFGGYATDWGSGSGDGENPFAVPPPDHPPTIQLTSNHLAALKRDSIHEN